MNKIFEKLIKQYPNDMELGKELRNLYIKKYSKKKSKPPKFKSYVVQ